MTGEGVEYSKVLINDGILRLPVWSTSAYKVDKSGRKATLTWGIKTNAIIYEVNVRVSTGAGHLTGSYKPNSGGIVLSQTWTYKNAGTYSVSASAQMGTSKGYAAPISPVRVLYI